MLLAAALPLTGTAPAEEPAAPVLEVLTFNIRYPNPADGVNFWPLRVKFTAEVMLATAPDIVGLQEATRRQLDDLKPHLDGYAEIGAGRDDGATKGEYSAILYKTAVLEPVASGTFWLSDTPAEPGSRTWGNTIPRICTWAQFRHRATGRGFLHFNSHWDHLSDASRKKSGELIAERITGRAAPTLPVVLTGDFNCEGRDAALTPLRTAGLLDTFRVLHPGDPNARTFHGWKGGTAGDKIDYVWVSPGVRTIEAEIIRTNREGRYPSDHYPVRAKIALPAQDTPR